MGCIDKLKINYKEHYNIMNNEELKIQNFEAQYIHKRSGLKTILKIQEIYIFLNWIKLIFKTVLNLNYKQWKMAKENIQIQKTNKVQHIDCVS